MQCNTNIFNLDFPKQRKNKNIFYTHIKINQLQTWKDTFHIYNKLLYKIAFIYISTTDNNTIIQLYNVHLNS